MTVKARLFETPKANLNGVRVTSAFLNEIVENEEKYVGLPLVADVKSLADGHYDHLGHLYDARTGQFHTAQIGSFYKFEEEKFDNGSYLVGYARIAKRNKALCHAIAELFTENALKFSFEITCGSIQKLEDGTMLIDASESNYLEGEAIVSFPACEDAVALELVAECDKLADDLRKGENEMTDVKESAEVAVKTAEEAQVEQPEEEASCNKKKECSEDEVEETTAETEVTETTDVETVEQANEEDTSVVAEGEPENTEEQHENAEGESAESESEESSDVADSIVIDVEQQNKKTAEEMIAELMEIVNSLKTEIAELKENSKPVFAELSETVTINPLKLFFIGKGLMKYNT